MLPPLSLNILKSTGTLSERVNNLYRIAGIIGQTKDIYSVDRNIDPSLPIMVFKRIYICLGSLKEGFWALKRELLGLDGAFMKGSFIRQVLAAVGLKCLGDDIDLQPNSNFTFIND
ncbi:hypothetical protein Tco_1207075 [Tanacetum coccineum]